ncbi:MAG: quercetin dioxygenase-like cupin family protein [Candidatus Latescibacterota bacterium]|jgi:quercetin dioxygenase-like cupin family protein|tara:strand:+ start:288 stop:689 length:402 start_codon:yes stop_codon:yes gene_type:complete
MEDKYGLRDCFAQPEENHGHPGSISRVIIGPNARRSERPNALDSERLVIHTNEYEPGGLSGDGHSHSDQEQAFYILEGDMEVDVGDETHQLSAGDCVLLPRGVFHKHRNIGEKPLKFLFISAMLGAGPPPGDR